jgi:hypothetical protein
MDYRKNKSDPQMAQGRVDHPGAARHLLGRKTLRAAPTINRGMNGFSGCNNSREIC